MYSKELLDRIEHLNREPHNQAARKHLRPDELSTTDLHGLILALKALEDWPACNERYILEDLLAQVSQRPPEEQMFHLYGLDNDEQVINAADLAAKTSPREAGDRILQCVRGR